MIEIALFAGLALLGTVLAREQERTLPKPPMETFLNPMPLQEDNDKVVSQQDVVAHGNMVPYFGSKMTQSMSSDVHQTRLDHYTGNGEHHTQKREEKSFFDIVPGATNSPFGNPNESDFMQSRQVTSLRMNNVFPIEKMLVGPGVDDGYTNLPSGGYNQDRARDVTMPKTTDELRTVNNPKVSYTSEPTPGAFYVSQPGLQAPVNKNRPDRFGVLSSDTGELMYLNTAVGAQVAPAAFPEQMVKQQQRDTTNKEYYGAAQNGEGGGLSYIRSFTEPFEQFMKLTVGEHFGTGGAAVPATYTVDAYNAAYTNPNREHISSTEYFPGAGLLGGANPDGDKLNVSHKKEIEDQLQQSARFQSGGMSTVQTAQQQGTIRSDTTNYFDASAIRNTPDILSAFNSNPYTHSLTSVA